MGLQPASIFYSFLFRWRALRRSKVVNVGGTILRENSAPPLMPIAAGGGHFCANGCTHSAYFGAEFSHFELCRKKEEDLYNPALHFRL